jgi:hypothetical protein
MRYAIFFPCLLLLSFLMVACGSSDNSAQLEAQVMSIHDEVMPKTAQINQLSQQIRKEVERMQSDPEADDVRLATFQATLQDLEVAEQSMMNWMRNYSKQYLKEKEHMTDEERTIYLEDELSRVKEVKQSMIQSITQAEKLTVK